MAGGACVGDGERLQIRVDAIGKGQVHQHSAGQGAVDGVLANRQRRAVFVVQQQDEFFGEGQHGGDATAGEALGATA